MLRRPCFTELFLTRSRARPRLLFLLEGADDECSSYSSPQPQNPDGKSSLVVAADFHAKISAWIHNCGYSSGLIYFPDSFVVFNPITGGYKTLPDVLIYRKSTSFLGLDPIDKQFKVLAEGYPFCPERDHHKILRLGTEKLRWRSKKGCPWYNSCWSEGICINGVLYYLATTKELADYFNEAFDDESSVKIVCFDVRSEKFKLIGTKSFCDEYTTRLVNYKGKVGGVILDKVDNAIELRMWVLEDVEKEEWSKYVYTLPENASVDHKNVSIAGVTATGEIVLSMDVALKSKPFYVFYFNPERNTLQSVEIQGFGENFGSVKVFIDHVEDLNVHDASLLKSIRKGEDEDKEEDEDEDEDEEEEDEEDEDEDEDEGDQERDDFWGSMRIVVV